MLAGVPLFDRVIAQGRAPSPAYGGSVQTSREALATRSPLIPAKALPDAHICLAVLHASAATYLFRRGLPDSYIRRGADPSPACRGGWPVGEAKRTGGVRCRKRSPPVSLLRQSSMLRIERRKYRRTREARPLPPSPTSWRRDRRLFPALPEMCASRSAFAGTSGRRACLNRFPLQCGKRENEVRMAAAL
jgi:hypothetical protein